METPAASGRTPSPGSPNPVPWKRAGLQRVLRAVRHQAAALRHGWRHDPAIRQVGTAVIVAVLVALVAPVARIERVLLVLTAMLVAVAEVLNSAIEACVDRISPDPHPLSKVAKDYASLAVAGTVLIAVVCWATILGPVALGWAGR